MPELDNAAKSKRRRGWPVGCSILALLALALGINTMCALTEADRNAGRVHEAIQPGMTVTEVTALLADMQVRSTYEVGSGADAKASSAATFIKDLAAQSPVGAGQSAGRLSTTFLGGGPAKASFTVEFDADGRVLSVGEIEYWD